MSLDATIDEGSLAAVAALLGVPDAAALVEVRLESLQQRTHRQLLEASRKLGLSGASRPTQGARAAKRGRTLPELARNRPSTAVKAVGPVLTRTEPAAEPEPVPEPVLSHKFEVGKHGASKEEPRTIP